jgi:tetratricopeptide (TPR) repeat protein
MPDRTGCDLMCWVRSLRFSSAVFLVLAAPPGRAQDAPAPEDRLPVALLTRPTLLVEGIGHAHDAVATRSKDAQAFYDQGLAYGHSHLWIDAARSFHQALRLDPTLAIAHVGLSYAYGALEGPAAARAELTRARAQLTGPVGGPPHDRWHFELRALQLEAEEMGDVASLAAYRNALDGALLQYPGDVELWLLRGLAQAPDARHRGEASVATSIGFFERALALAPEEAAAHHYLVHACENAGCPADALPHAAAYALAAPAVAHARHLHGHALSRAGRMEEATVAFESADRLGAAYLAREQVPPEYAGDYDHNLYMLAAAYRYRGRLDDAERLLAAAFAWPSTSTQQTLAKGAWPEFLVARGRPLEAEAAARVLLAGPTPLGRAVGQVAAGYAWLAAGEVRLAVEAANAALKELGASPGDAAALVALALETLQGELLLRSGQREQGRAMLDEVARRVRELPGPDAWAPALFALDAIGRVAREVGDWDFAGFIARQLIGQDSRYAGAHYALGLVAEHNGDDPAARAAFARAEQLWTGADADLPELVAIRRRLR